LAGEGKIISASRLMEFCQQAFQKAGMNAEDSRVVADILVSANLRGVDSHGVMRVPPYIRRLLDGGANPSPRIRAMRRGPSFVRLDGDRGLGLVVSVHAMKEAIALASQSGVGVAAVFNSDHFGAAAYYAMLALKHDMIGVAMTNAAAVMALWGGKTPFMGNNPIAVAVPCGTELSIVLDMAVSKVAGGKVRLAVKKGTKIPFEWIIDKDGMPTDDPKEFEAGGTLLPLGIKGYGLGVIVEVLCGILSGARILSEIPLWFANTAEPVGVGHFMMAINVDSFLPIQEFKDRVDQLVRRIHSAPRALDVDRIYLPGEIEHLSERKRKAEGIPVPEAVYRDLLEIGHELNVNTEKLG
jgi:LDH2 family malate/lactate/ureidoglycolate dehydrogenase